MMENSKRKAFYVADSMEGSDKIFHSFKQNNTTFNGLVIIIYFGTTFKVCISESQLSKHKFQTYILMHVYKIGGHKDIS